MPPPRHGPPGRSARLARALFGLLVLIMAPSFCAAAREPALFVHEPARTERGLRVPYTLEGIFDEEIVAALESGLAATLAFRWELKRERGGWWDERVLAGRKLFRIFYDVLEERYTIFNDAGRVIAGCEAVAAVESTLCERGELLLPLGLALDRDQAYYVGLEARLEPLDADEIRDLEGWLRRGGGQDAFSGVSRYAEGVLKRMAGLGSRSVGARSGSFRGGG